VRHKCATQDAPASAICQRWVAERFFATIQWLEFYPKNFLCFVQLACRPVGFK
jgi:hypothetical protein